MSLYDTRQRVMPKSREVLDACHVKLATAERKLAEARDYAKALNTVLRRHNKAGAVFQPGGRFNGAIALGSDTCVDGIAWLVAQHDSLTARLAEAREALEKAKHDAWRQVRIWEPNIDMHVSAMAVFTAAFGENAWASMRDAAQPPTSPPRD